MIIDDLPRLCYRCPVCGTYYRASRYRSCNSFLGRNVFSDGSVDNYACNRLWLTKCPHCKQFFAKKYLLPIGVVDEDSLPPHTPCGSVDYLSNGIPSRYSIRFWREALKKGLYFPPVADEAERNRLQNDAYLGLWRAANRDLAEYGEERYGRLCRALIERLSPETDKERLCIAELYRNLGDFDASLGALRFVRERRRWCFHVYAIERTALVGYKQTVKLNIL